MNKLTLAIILLSTNFTSATAQTVQNWEYGILQVFTRYTNKSKYVSNELNSYSIYWLAEGSNIEAVNEFNPNGIANFMKNLVGNEKISLYRVDTLEFQNAMGKKGWELTDIDTEFTEYGDMYVKARQYWYKRLIK